MFSHSHNGRELNIWSRVTSTFEPPSVDVTWAVSDFFFNFFLVAVDLPLKDGNRESSNHGLQMFIAPTEHERSVTGHKEL